VTGYLKFLNSHTSWRNFTWFVSDNKWPLFTSDTLYTSIAY